MEKKILFIPAIFLAIALIGLTSAAPMYCEGATYNFTCGDIINESCIFDANLNCVALGGVAVHGSSIIVDCNGYDFTAILGPSGMTLNGGDENITIKDCHFEGWGRPIDITNSNGSNILNNTFYNFSVAAIDAVDWGYANIYGNAIDCQEPTTAVGILVSDGFMDGGNADIKF